MTEHMLYLLGPYEVPSLPSQSARRVRVYVPPGASSGAPVLYMFDGQNIFHDGPSFAGGWHLHRTAYRLAQKKHRAPVIVGIDHGGAARIEELSPWASSKGQGRADALLDWVIGTLAPRIRAEFGTSTEPAHTGVGGSSMGGLCALYAHFRNPEHFGLAMAMSPSLWFAGEQLLEYVAARPKPWTSRVYVDAGALEGKGAAVAAVQRLTEALRGRGYDDASLHWVHARRGAHSEQHWRRRAPGAMEFLFGTPAGAPKTLRTPAKRASSSS